MPIEEDPLDSDHEQPGSGAMGPMDDLSDQTPLEDDDSDYESGKA